MVRIPVGTWERGLNSFLQVGFRDSWFPRDVSGKGTAKEETIATELIVLVSKNFQRYV